MSIRHPHLRCRVACSGGVVWSPPCRCRGHLTTFVRFSHARRFTVTGIDQEAKMRRMLAIPALVAVMLLTPASARADVVQDWKAIMLSTIGGQSPFAQARFAAITQLAVFEAVNACTGKYAAYLGTIAATFGASSEAGASA